MKTEPCDTSFPNEAEIQDSPSIFVFLGIWRGGKYDYLMVGSDRDYESIREARVEYKKPKKSALIQNMEKME